MVVEAVAWGMPRRPYERTVKPNGSILIRVVVGYDGRNPLRKTRTFSAGTRDDEINAWAYGVKANNPYEIRTPGRPIGPQRVLDAWIEAKRYSVGDRTHVNYATYKRLYLDSLNGFSSDEVAKWFHNLRRADGKRLGIKTQETVRTLLKNVISFAIEEGMLVKAPKVPAPVGIRRVNTTKALGVNDYLRLATHLADNEELALETMLHTGLRVSELLALGCKHVSNRSIHVEQVLSERWGSRETAPPKSRSSHRTINLPPDLYQRLVLKANQRRRVGDRFLFPIGQSGLRLRLRKACHALRLPTVSLHMLRHSHATFLLAQGVNIVLVSKRLGHFSPSLTLRTYAHLVPEMDEKLGAAFGVIDHLATS